MTGWTKFFLDGTAECGTDLAIRQGLASWSNGRLKDVYAVNCTDGKEEIVIVGSVGEFWQSDDYESVAFQPDSKLVVRRIQRKIQPGDKHIGITKNSTILMLLVLPLPDLNETIGKFIGSHDSLSIKTIDVTPDMYNSWLTVTIDTITRQLSWEILKDRI